MMIDKPSVSCGKRLLPAVIDELAQNDPHRPWASLPVDDYDLSQGYEDISYAALANAINKLAGVILSSFGRSTSFETIAYLGISDIRYHMMEMAVCKTGHKVLFSSQLNTLSVHMSLMEQTGCIGLLYAAGVKVDDIIEGRPMPSFCIPDLDDLLDEADQAPHIPYTKTFAEAAQDPFLVLHSSGSTGLPKVVVMNHAAIATQDAQRLLPNVAGRAHALGLVAPGFGTRVLMATAPYHVISSCIAMNMSVFGGGVFIPGFRHRGVKTEEACEILKYAKVENTALLPWMMEDIARRPDAKDYIEPLRNAFFGGAPLSPETSNIWAKYTRVVNIWGSTETLGCAQLILDNEDHPYAMFDPVHSGVIFRPASADYISDDGARMPLYKMVLTLTEESALCAAWHAREGITLKSKKPYEEFEVGDIWTPHPDPGKAGRVWRYMGRTDDLITFSTAVSFHPGPVERALNRHEFVKSSIVVGSGRRQPMILIELGEDATVDARQVLWETVLQPTNEILPSVGRVSPNHVVMLPPGSFVRAPKGTIVRRLTELKFAKDINETYARFGDTWQESRERYEAITQTVHFTVEYTDAINV